ncbi:MAG: hypothetical protein IIB95_13760 [Candidatus Marinimicrobia bacterium]|nr:hypothetical protein [Candidatus Neomarinimicrobiota bacterium]
MNPHFDSNLQFQIDAIQSVVYRLFNKNDQLKTNASLQMKDAGIEFKVV